MKNIAKIAAVSAILSVGNIEAKNIERTGAMHCVSTDLQNLAKNILMKDTRTDVLQNVLTTTADFTKSREKLSENPPELKTVLEQYDSLKDTPEELRKYLKDNQITTKILQNWYDKLNKDYTVSLNARNREASEINGYNQGHAKQYQKDVDDELAPLDKALEKNINQRVSIATMIDLLNIPDDAEKIGIKNMDPVFAEILENPKFAGTIKNNKELNQAVFAGFSPEFQKRFNELGLILKVEKDGNEIEVYIVCGTDKNGEIYDVKFLKSKKTNIVTELIQSKEYGLIISETATYKGKTKTQQIREINPEQLEKITIQEDGEQTFSRIITKNSNIHGNKVANN